MLTGVIFGCQFREDPTGIWWVGPREAAKYLIMHGTDTPKLRIIWTKYNSAIVDRSYSSLTISSFFKN